MLFYLLFKKYKQGTSLVVQWLGRYISTSGGSNSIPNQVSKSPNPNPLKKKKKKGIWGLCWWSTALVKLRASNARVTGSISVQGARIPHAVWHDQKNFKQKEIQTDMYVNTSMYEEEK